ncbi:glycine cleavage system protein R [Solemya velum gill symbiont]|uniref:Glycine cleavage system transcriptional repressor n=1 Tax=Solemya velum gill symbiont TaxID=2340 RepID=A0A0B0H9K3_SOVGS|nr:ACT domain-containing protein [Solemya velum gill symbiont]KHF24141.1 glycine cleavage system regulatory protein [Solemya velum gill symbiont]OOY36113.1 glycine cleavage system protein R [Solemya velum gill symbiont]OOY38181.1 glycine cleavage system protein R [Solemya velum gill symbiont]OOY39981.1 glycine cleavage system protein R [Solemya velum gill symbiont]OOY43985.1 glycine cleavage system protein R [Solemya velum gill symbiont]
MQDKQQQLVISAIGSDRPGIGEQLTDRIAKLDLNITDSRMTVLGGEFAIQMLIKGAWNQLSKLEQALPAIAESLGLQAQCKRTESRQSADMLVPYAVNVVALDHPGIVHKLSDFFAQRQINIQDLSTSSYSAAHTGTPMFAVNLLIGIPSQVQIPALRTEFMEYCDSLNLDAVLEPVTH